MEESPKQPNPYLPERLTFEQPSGWYSYGRIPYKIYYDLECPTGEGVNKKNPGGYTKTPDTKGGESLSIFVHKSVPRAYKDIVIFHELVEAELVFAGGIPEPEAHQLAVRATKDYAKKYLSKDEFGKFMEWQKGLSIK